MYYGSICIYNCTVYSIQDYHTALACIVEACEYTEILHVIYNTLWLGNDSHTDVSTSSGLMEKGIIIFT